MKEDTEFDPAARRLCPDGSCTGILDSDGRCSECGRSTLEAPSSSEPVFGPRDPDAIAPSPSLSPSLVLDGGGLDGSSTFNADRVLCPDGSCVGVVGTDGRCSVCGKNAAAH